MKVAFKWSVITPTTGKYFPLQVRDCFQVVGDNTNHREHQPQGNHSERFPIAGARFNVVN
jgi:hypothetical protein